MAEPAYDIPGSPRLPWAELPAHVRAAVEAHLGSPVVEAVSQAGGFSPGTAARVRCADGATAFVKAVGSVLNTDTPALHRAEALVAAALPADLATPTFRFAFDDGDWVALVFDASPGRLVRLPWTRAEAARVLAAIGEFTARLSPCPVPGLPSARDQLSGDLTAWQRLAADPPADLDPWEARHLDRLAETSAALIRPGSPLAGDSLVHLDLRADNILVEPGGRTVFVDFPWACRGARWLDSVMFVLDPLVHGGVQPEPLLAAAAALDDVDQDAVTGLILALAGMWAEGFRRPVPPGMPTIRAFQRRFHDAALAWGRDRAGWE